MWWTFSEKCRHKWDVESTDYTPPLDSFKLKGGLDDDTLRRMIEGVTHVYMCCTHCGDLKEKSVLGKYEPVKKNE